MRMIQSMVYIQVYQPLVARAACFLAVQYSFGVWLGRECMCSRIQTMRLAWPGLAPVALLVACCCYLSQQLSSARLELSSTPSASGPSYLVLIRI